MSRTVRRLLPLLLCLFAWASTAQAQECVSMGGSCSIPQNGQSSTCSTNELESGTCVVQGQQGVCCLPKVCEERSGSSACYAGVTCPAGTVSMGDGGCTTGSCCATIATPTPTPTPNPSPTPPPGGGSGGGTYRLEFVHTDMLGSVRMVTDAAGAVVSRHDYKPFGEEVGADEGGRSDIAGYSHPDWDPRARERFTGKPRDPSGLDYFGARYYSGAMGRFTSPDPLLSSGRPWLPQSWNRYAYTLNNPLRYTDPLGLYEWDKKCKQGDSTCEANRQQFRDSLANLTKAAGNYAAGSKERRQLDAIIARIGTEGDGNKTRIGFNANMKDLGQTFGNKMTFNFQAMNNSLSRAEADSGTVSTAGAALVGHEGQHLVDGTLGVSGLKYLLNIGKERVKQELQPFTVESYVFQSFNKLEPFGYSIGVSNGDANGWPLWDPSWAAADADKLRQANVQKVVEELYGKKKK